MPQFDIPEFHSPIDGAPFDIRAPRAALVVVIAGVAILALAAVGFYRGLTSGKPSAAEGSVGSTSAIVGAKPAVPVAQNPNWSILSGPQVLPAPTAKAQTDDDNDDDDSDTQDDQPTTADQAPTPTTPTPPPTVPAKTIAPTSAQPPASEPPPF